MITCQLLYLYYSLPATQSDGSEVIQDKLNHSQSTSCVIFHYLQLKSKCFLFQSPLAGKSSSPLHNVEKSEELLVFRGGNDPQRAFQDDLKVQHFSNTHKKISVCFNNEGWGGFINVNFSQLPSSFPISEHSHFHRIPLNLKKLPLTENTRINVFTKLFVGFFA